MTSELNQLVGKLSKAMEDNDTLMTAYVAAKLRKCAEVYPNDPTIMGVAQVVNKLEDKQMLITRAEFKKLYRQFHTSNTKFAQLFPEELGTPEVKLTPKTYARDPNESTPVEVSGADEVLVNALASVFDKSKPLVEYSSKLAKQASDRVLLSLDDCALMPNKVTVEAGSENIFIINAHYETPKGVTTIAVPVEVHGSNLVDTGIFISNAGVQELNKSNLKNYITKNAGVKPNYNCKTIVDGLSRIMKEANSPSDVEMAMAKMSAKRSGGQEFFANSLFGEICEEARPDVQVEKSDDYASFEARFASPKGSAEFILGADVVRNGRDVIARTLAGYGYKNSQVKVAKHDERSVSYAVAIDGKVGFMVPLKVAGKKISAPTVLISNGSISEFSDVSINELFKRSQKDHKVLAVASPQFGLKASELLTNIREAVEEGNLSKAEDALNVLAKVEDAKAYGVGVELYMSALAGETKKEACTCTNIIRHASSQHPICGHTGLPLHKVYQDKFGACRPLHRRGNEECDSESGVLTMTAKLFS